MIRSLIGIVCVLVFTTACVQSTAAQALGEYSSEALRGRDTQSQLSRWIELADQGVCNRLLSSDAYHNDFRFRAAPVKRPRNWKMPIVDVRPAKEISTTFSQPLRSTPPVETQLTVGSNRAPVVDWVWQSSSDLAVRYCELDDPIDQVSLDFIPRPLPPQAKPIATKTSKVKLLELKLVKVISAKQKSAANLKMATVGVRRGKTVPSTLNSKIENGSTARKPYIFSRSSSDPVVDWVWQSSSDLAVRYCELDDPLDSASLAFIPRPLPPQAKPVATKTSKVKRLELELVKVESAEQKRAMNLKMPTVDVRPAKTVPSTLDSEFENGSTAHKPHFFTDSSTDPVVDWVWQSSSDLAVRYCELDDPLDSVSLAFIPRPLPPQVKPVEAKPSNVKRLELKLVKVISAEQRLRMAEGRKDYWTYYADCDRWNVVFAIPKALPPSDLKDDQQVVDAPVVDRKKSKITSSLNQLAADIAQRWENAISYYRTISKRFLASRL